MTQDEIKIRHKRFLEMVRKMRACQKAYFRYHSSQDLDSAKRYEREVDKFIKDEDDRAKSPQTEIF